MPEPVESEVREVSFPTTLYFQHPDKRMIPQVVADQAAYDAARAAGWRSSPSSFGVETHPSQPGLAASQRSFDEPAQATASMAEVTGMLVSLQAHVEHTHQILLDLAQRLGTLETAAHTGPAARPPEVARTPSAGSHATVGPAPPPPEDKDEDDTPHPRRR
jgi:hypothetical protein